MSKNYDDSDGVWRTIGGRKVFIRTGQSLSDAMKESGKFKKKAQTEEEKAKKMNDTMNKRADIISKLDEETKDLDAYDRYNLAVSKLENTDEMSPTERQYWVSEKERYEKNALGKQMKEAERTTRQINDEYEELSKKMQQDDYYYKPEDDRKLKELRAEYDSEVAKGKEDVNYTDYKNKEQSSITERDAKDLIKQLNDEGSDFTFDSDVTIEDGKLKTNVGVFMPGDEEDGGGYTNRELEIPIDKNETYDSLEEKLRDWEYRHNSPDSFYDEDFASNESISDMYEVYEVDGGGYRGKGKELLKFLKAEEEDSGVETPKNIEKQLTENPDKEYIYDNTNEILHSTDKIRERANSNVKEEAKTWNEAYKDFEKVADYPNKSEKEIQNEVKNIYNQHKGEKAYEEAYNRWNGGSGTKEFDTSIDKLENYEVYERADSLARETKDYALKDEINKRLDRIDRANAKGSGYADKPTNELREILKGNQNKETSQYDKMMNDDADFKKYVNDNYGMIDTEYDLKHHTSHITNSTINSKVKNSKEWQDTAIKSYNDSKLIDKGYRWRDDDDNIITPSKDFKQLEGGNWVKQNEDGSSIHIAGSKNADGSHNYRRYDYDKDGVQVGLTREFSSIEDAKNGKTPSEAINQTMNKAIREKASNKTLSSNSGQEKISDNVKVMRYGDDYVVLKNGHNEKEFKTQKDAEKFANELTASQASQNQINRLNEYEDAYDAYDKAMEKANEPKSMNDKIRAKASKKSTYKDDLPKHTEIKTQGTSNRKEVSENIQAHILDYYGPDYTGDDSVSASQAFIEQMDAMRAPTKWHAGEELASGGSYLIYTDDMRTFLNDLKINPKGKDFDDDKVFQTYKSLIGRESAKLYDRLLKNEYQKYKQSHPLTQMSLQDYIESRKK